MLVVLLLSRELQPASEEAEVAVHVLSLKNGLQIALIDVV